MSIEVRNVTKRFRTGAETAGFVAVDNVSFTVAEGSLTALLGPSGSGKSTILRIIAGLEFLDAGEVYLDNRLITGHSVQDRGIGFVFQHYALFKHMTVWDNIAFGLKVRKASKSQIRQRVNEMLDLIQLKGYEHRYPSQLSGGQRQRVALARALAARPRVLLLDEPFGSLDAKVRANLAGQLRRLHDEFRTTSIFVTHDQEEAFEIADQIVVINRGRVEQIGSAEEVYEEPSSKFVASFIGHVNVIEAFVTQGKVTFGPRRVSLAAVTAPITEGEIVFLVRPENIEPVTDGGEDCLEAEIKVVRYRGDHYDLDLEVAGLELRMIENIANARLHDIHPGKRFCVRFKRYAVFSAEEGHAALRAKLQGLGYLE